MRLIKLVLWCTINIKKNYIPQRMINNRNNLRSAYCCASCSIYKCFLSHAHAHAMVHQNPPGGAAVFT